MTGIDRIGKVFLVGAGPGDPGLLTKRAAELIASADLIAVDALVSKEIMSTFPANAEVVYVGKRASAHTLPQEQINQLLIVEAIKGRRVVRLKGGDPFVFGRGGEEAEELVAAGIPIEIVPGISSSIAGPAYAGIPVTHRSHATSLTLITGHESDDSTGIDWPVVARLRGTIVFMMGFGNLPQIVRNLIENGMPAERPVAVISKATTREQRTVAGTLADIDSRVASANLATPALIVVGDVVKMHDVINWFETKPLFGKRIIVTRAREQASDLKRLFDDSGAQVLQFPTIEIAPPESYDSLDRIIDVLSDYQWIIFTSPNGVQHFFDRLREHGDDARALAGVMVAAVGQATANDLRARGVNPDLVPEKFLSTALLPLLEADQKGIRTAVIRAEEGREELIEELRRRGGEVDLGIAYRTIAADYDLDELRELIADRAIDVVTFTSASTVDHFFGRLTTEERAGVIEHALLASIGPTTTEAIRKYGRGPDVEAKNATVQALHDAVLDALSAAAPTSSS
ncbi:MAG: uroporphyrinogen-III C-methyltransferase [Thermoanaerobaculia bacterium]